MHPNLLLGWKFFTISNLQLPFSQVIYLYYATLADMNNLVFFNLKHAQAAACLEHAAACFGYAGLVFKLHGLAFILLALVNNS